MPLLLGLLVPLCRFSIYCSNMMGRSTHGSTQLRPYACVPQYSIINVTGQAIADNCAAELQKVQKSSNGVEVVNNVTVLLRDGPSTITQRVYHSSTHVEGES